MISTDTAFLVGALAIIAPKYPARLRTFLLTLAVVDDVGALAAIALFYSEQIRIVPLVVAVLLVAALIGVRFLPAALRGVAYSILAVALWLALFAGGGVHPTLAGVVVALVIPVFTPRTSAGGGRRRRDPGVPPVTEFGVRPRRHPQPA